MQYSGTPLLRLIQKMKSIFLNYQRKRRAIDNPVSTSFNGHHLKFSVISDSVRLSNIFNSLRFTVQNIGENFYAFQ